MKETSTLERDMFDLTPAHQTDVVPHDGNFSAAAHSAAECQCRAVRAVICVALVGLTSAAVLLLADDGNTPWFDASTGLAIAMQGCAVATESGLRHEGQREVAEGDSQLAPSSGALARH